MDGKTILVVEDEEDLRDFLVMLLEDHGFQCLTASEGRQGLELALQEKPDLISLDLSLPRHSGVRMYSQLQQHSEARRIPVVIVTGVPGDLEQILQDNHTLPKPAAWFEKPLDRQAFLETLHRLLN